MAFLSYETEADVYRYTCSDLPCADVGVGIYHHPLCSIGFPSEYEDLDDIFGPFTPDEEEMLPEDTDADISALSRI